MERWRDAVSCTQDTSSTELKLLLQSLIFELHGKNLTITDEEVKELLLNTHKRCTEPQTQIKWCQLAVLALNYVECKFAVHELNKLVEFVLEVCKETNYLYSTVETLGALLYNTDINVLNTLDLIVGESGVVLQLCLGLAPEREVQHLALRCLNNMLSSMTDEVFIVQITKTLTTLASSRLHGDNLNRIRLLCGVMKCLQTIAKYNKSQYVLEQILSNIKGCMLEGISTVSSPAVSLDSLSLDDLNFSDFSDSHSKQSQPRVRNKKGRNKKKKQVVTLIEDDVSSWRRSPSGSALSTGGPSNKHNAAVLQPAKPSITNKYSDSKNTNVLTEKSTAHSSAGSNQHEINKNMGFETTQTDFYVSTSESEYSESDTEEGLLNKVQAVKCRTRLTSLITLQHCISNVQKSSMYSVWCAFLPPDPTTGLLYVLQKEQNAKCRIAALGALSLLIEASKHYFLAADLGHGSVPSKAPYTPFSKTLATAIITLHNGLIYLIPGCHSGVLPHLIQCIAILVLHTPFKKLSTGIISNILTECKKILSPNAGVSQYKTQSATLNLLSACFTAQTPLDEVQDWLSENNDIVKDCLAHLVHTQHQKDTLQVVCQLLRFYFSPVSMWWRDVADSTKHTLHSTSDTLIQNMCLLVFEELGKALSSALDSGNPNVQLIPVKEHWDSVLGTVVVPILQNETSLVTPGACDILSTIGNSVFASFETHTQRLIMTLLLALTNPTISATSSACRCLGVMVTYPCVRDDLLFVADTANAIIKSMECTDSSDGALLLRVSWSLGNLSDTLVVNKLNNPAFVSDFSDLLLGRLFDVSLASANENDKVKSNVVRALGNLLRFIKPATYEKAHFVEYVRCSVECLIKCSTSGMMKTRWNACYAIVNTLQNPALSPAQSTWGGALFRTLCSVIIQCKNYKVRINASLALLQCSTRDKYGPDFYKIWSTALIVLCDPDKGGGGQMFGYTEKLRLQLLLLVCHFLKLHLSEDRDTLISALPPPHLHNTMILQCSVVSTSDTLSPADRSLIEDAKRVCEVLHPRFDLIYMMLQPKELPSDTEAFATSDIVSMVNP